MKRLAGLMILLVLISNFGCAKKDLTSNRPFDSAVISYTYQGARIGNETVYIDLKSNNIAVETSVTTTFKGIVDNDESVRIYDGQAAYSVDMKKKQAIKVSKQGAIIPEMFGEAKYLQYFTEQVSFLEKPCKAYKLPQGEIYFWQGIPLKEEMTLSGMTYTKTATDIELNTPIPAAKFKLPSEVEVFKAEDLMKDFQKKFKNLKR
ncbi:MAG: hypothetical protein PHV17_09985 [Candidatus Omnitrophica bacterium]|nr:hypothetical protein [Candidatus Omnitrophota bacterium]